MSDAPSGGTAAPISGGEFAGRVVGAAVLILLSALFSGLTLGYLGLDVSQLEIIKTAGEPEQRRLAAIIQPIRKQGNLLLATLVLGNVSVTSLSAIVLADLTSGYVGFAVSTILIVLFGEIIPQAVCSRYALVIGARCIPIVRVIIFLFWPVTKPIAVCLDYFLGQEIGTTYTRDEFMKLVAMQVGSNLFHSSEATIIGGALTFRAKTVKETATGLDKMFAVKATDVLDQNLLSLIFQSGFSRVPVWDDPKHNIVGVLYVKDLVLITPEQRQPVISVVHYYERELVNVVDDIDTLEKTLKMFIATHQHFAIVRTVEEPPGGGDPVYRVCGLITMEDILEEIMGINLHDGGGRGPGRATHHKRIGASVLNLPALGDTDGVGAAPMFSPAETRATAAHLLTNVPAFAAARVPFSEVEALVRSSRIVALSRGETLFAGGERAAALVLRGTIEAADGLQAGPWEIVGDSALATSAAKSALSSAASPRFLAKDDAVVLVISQGDFFAMFERTWGGGGKGGVGGGGVAVPQQQLASTPPASPALSQSSSMAGSVSVPILSLSGRNTSAMKAPTSPSLAGDGGAAAADVVLGFNPLRSDEDARG
jgi:metal transporter CNNM